MATKALLVRLEAKSGKEDAVEEFLLSALPLVEQEPGTKPWFAVRFGPSTFGIIDAFPDEAARETHLGGPVGKALAEKADELFASPPDISNLDVIANNSDAVAAEYAILTSSKRPCRASTPSRYVYTSTGQALGIFFGLWGQVRAPGLGLTGPCRSRRRGAKVLIQAVAPVTGLVWPRRDTRPELVGCASIPQRRAERSAGHSNRH